MQRNSWHGNLPRLGLTDSLSSAVILTLKTHEVLCLLLLLAAKDFPASKWITQVSCLPAVIIAKDLFPETNIDVLSIWGRSACMATLWTFHISESGTRDPMLGGSHRRRYFL